MNKLIDNDDQKQDGDNGDKEWTILPDVIGRQVPPSILGDLNSIKMREIDTSHLLANKLDSLMNSNMDLSTVGKDLLSELHGKNWFATAVHDLFKTRSVPLSDDKYFKDLDPKQGGYSQHLSKVEDYFAGREKDIDSVRKLNEAIGVLSGNAGGLQLVWRGARSVKWGTHSGLFRKLCETNGVKPPADRPIEDQNYPDEDQMVAAEREMLRIARRDWRLDGMSALETFARIQHYGGPTRLLDVTKNPYVATWFAVEEFRGDKNRVKSEDDTDKHDSRLVAFATAPVAKDGEDLPSSRVFLDDVWGGRDPIWHSAQTSEERWQLQWGTGTLRRYWEPPAYDPRISAQNAGFILDGVPMTSQRTASYFQVHGSKGAYFKRADLLAAGSMYMKLSSPTARPRYNKAHLAPTFAFRIKAEAKEEIRNYLESRFGFTRSYIYPDMFELANHLNTIEL